MMQWAPEWTDGCVNLVVFLVEFGRIEMQQKNYVERWIVDS